MHWLDPAPFLRGTAWLDGDRPVRADPGDLERLPWDIAERAALPIGVRIEFTAAPGTRAVELRYRAAVPGSEDPLRALRHCFALWQGTRFVGETCAAPAPEAVVRLPSPYGGVFTLHLPEGQAPVPLALRAVGAPSPRPGAAPLARPRRLDHRGLVVDPPGPLLARHGGAAPRPRPGQSRVRGRGAGRAAARRAAGPAGRRGHHPRLRHQLLVPGAGHARLALRDGPRLRGPGPEGHPATRSSSSPRSCARRPSTPATPWGDPDGAAPRDGARGPGPRRRGRRPSPGPPRPPAPRPGAPGGRAPPERRGTRAHGARGGGGAAGALKAP
ncbi:hypothetical protein O1L60_06495 [Streptomyces diastatochromogenes]|nr:hypothetical protein [Streptomyces diastatochromogenes]